MKLLIILVTLAAGLVGCGDKAGECEVATFQCDAEVLQECADVGWVDLINCADEGMMCHKEMGHCMSMDDEDNDTGMSME